MSKTVSEKKTRSRKKTVSEKETVETSENFEDLPQEQNKTVEKHRVLYIMRHGKASKDFEEFTDRERPLIKRGKKDVKMMKHFFKNIKAAPQLCLVSPSVRTRETVQALQKAFPDAQIRFEETLYDDKASRSDLVDLLRAVPDDIAEVLVIGHLVPPIDALARLLANEGVSDEDGLKRMGKKFPTASVAILELNPSVAFKDLEENSCRLAAFVRPKDLND